MPTHYAFKVGNWLPGVEAAYERLARLKPDELAAERAKLSARPVRHAGRLSRGMEAAVRKVLDAQDVRGRWVDDAPLRYQGSDDTVRRTISSETFCRNVRVLAAYLAASAPR